jgi:hypothetical protein
MAQATHSPLLVVSVEDVLKRIHAAVGALTTSKSSPPTIETYRALDSLMKEVIKIERSGFVPELGPWLYAKFQELDHSVHCSELVALKYPHIAEHPNTMDFLRAITYLKLAALCTFDEARYEWANLAEIAPTVTLPHGALCEGDWIRLYNSTDCNYEGIDTLHDLVGIGMYLMCDAYKQIDGRFMLYMALLEEQSSSNIPHGVACTNYDQITTEACVKFLVQQLDERYY